MTTQALEASTFQNRPAYQYIRASDELPSIEDTLDLEGTELVAKVKLFDPTGSWTWYIAAYDPDTRLAYALVDGMELETGDISMEELVAFRGGFGLPIERDLYWTPKSFAAIRAEHRR